MLAVEKPSPVVRSPSQVARAVAVVLLLLVSGLAGATLGASLAAPTPASLSGELASDLTPAASHSFPSPIRHVVVVMDENQNYSTVLADGPFENYLARTYANATNDYSVAHGSTHGYEGATSAVASNNFPLAVNNIGDLTNGTGLTWAAFEQSMPTVCDRTLDWNVGYDTDHNPFIMYDDIVHNKTRCDAHDLTWSSWTSDVSSGSIPNYAFITPNVTNDDHNSSIPVGDAWLKSWLSPLLNDSFASTTAFFITFDEDAGNNKITPVVNGSSGGHIYTVIVSPYSKGLHSDTFYNTYSLLTTAEWLLGLPGGTLGTNDSWTMSPPMEDLFSFPSSSYKVKFTESGLPSKTSWSVTVDSTTESSTSTSITFTEPDGTYGYTATVTGSGSTSGSFTVSGAKLTVALKFYKVTFKETGLPSGTSWSVTANSVAGTSTTTSVVFYLVNGAYSFTIGTVPGYTSTPSSGSLTVSSAKLTESVKFTAG